MTTQLITDAQAKLTAERWHKGPDTALYDFSTTGRILTRIKDFDLLTEIRTAYDNARDEDQKQELHDLWHYVFMVGPRHVVEGWSLL